MFNWRISLTSICMFAAAMLCRGRPSESSTAAILNEMATIPIDLTRSGKLIPNIDKWTHGGFYRLARYDSTFYKLDSQDPTEPPITLSIPGASFTYVQDFDVTPNGSIIAAGFSEADGRRAHFIAIVPKDGQTRIVRTTPYWPFLLSVARDGSIWTTGTEEVYDQNGTATGTNPEAAVLRHFNASGVLIGAAETERTAPRGALSSGFLVATSRGVAWYGPRDGQAQYFIEASSNLQTITRYPGIAVPGDSSLQAEGSAPIGTEQATGFSVTDSGRAFVSTSITQPNGVSHHNLYLFDRASQTWRPVARPVMILHTLVGSQGEPLLFRANTSSGPALKRVKYTEQ